jgi:hypothetical protein
VKVFPKDKAAQQ